MRPAGLAQHGVAYLVVDVFEQVDGGDGVGVVVGDGHVRGVAHDRLEFDAELGRDGVEQAHGSGQNVGGRHARTGAGKAEREETEARPEVEHVAPDEFFGLVVDRGEIGCAVE